ncbi:MULTISPECIES: nascent polypeptide-associated complex protein [Methanobrevibacter]|jgi:nascent polypeptide-associated complex subunit alpha|uniref:nascent polypeptide-associated complex protein n=1 Tax=Methanobrevibacter TaxID=2172 RepID=UPI00033484B3|nr:MULTISPECIES: nascent polypeptide-associated complex protein [Methanobrevibacter]AGN16906.1 nascent polypeptide-associated complex protein [Methanobrevibacter sp. AbM4]MCI6775139.1 nascent polypeptide-associated complex protein [Methanobrevibacter boviskoreani]MCI6931396.1 nascent polypeptide-associated complex protein [Methanobrevibacter boviskoreani]MDD6256903.1 nascent polypeptide-associated complex protein [Methanobrevibacter boviskoreani]MDY5614739.1 nascent polypeptide-associated comp
MIPGMNPKQMKQMERQMKKMGMKMEDIEGVEEVVIKCEDKDIVISNPEVNVMTVMGSDTYQITGDAQEIEKEVEIEINQEDIELVANQAGVSAEDAENALIEAKGDLAEAILKLNQ